MPDKPPAPKEPPREPVRRLSYIGTLQNRLDEEVERRMAGLSSQDLKGVIAWLEAKQLELAIQKSVEDNHLEVLKGSGKQEVLLELLEDAHSRLGKTVSVEQSDQPAGGETDGSAE